MIKLWDMLEGSLLVDVPFMSDGLSGSGSKASASGAQCRGACLSRGVGAGAPMILYSIQSATRGPAHLVRWSVMPKQSTEGNGSENKDGFALRVVPTKALYISKTPATRLAISHDGLFVAVGCSDGTVHVLRTHTSLAKYSYFTCHDLPVTGLAFAPTKLATKAGAVALVSSGSADNRFAVMPIGTYSTWFTVLSRVLFFFIIVFLCLCAAAILFRVGPLEHLVPVLLVR